MAELTKGELYELPFQPREYVSDTALYSTIKMLAKNARETPESKGLCARAYNDSGRGAYEWYSFSTVLEYI